MTRILHDDCSECWDILWQIQPSDYTMIRDQSIEDNILDSAGSMDKFYKLVVSSVVHPANGLILGFA